MKEKTEKLKAQFLEYAREDVCVAFSGGVDSSLVLAMAWEAAGQTGKRVYALTMDTVLHPAADLEIARKVLNQIRESGTAHEPERQPGRQPSRLLHEVLFLDELALPEIRRNPVNRCYLCKKTLYSRMLAFAHERGAAYVLEGSNEDDLHVYRPGLRAVKELGVHSPLADCGVTKEEVRTLAARYGLSVASRPSTPCMATRLPYGTEIDLSLLKRIDAAEQSLRAMGLKNVRVRVHGNILRLEVDAGSLSFATAHREEITALLKPVGCPYLTLDLEGFRSGSMDIGTGEKI